MFAKTIIDSDAFLDMPISARLLYYDLGMRADDDGFINSPKKIMRIIGASSDDLSLLGIKKFIIPFESGVVVIKHWKIHNFISKDRYSETKYKAEKSTLTLDENKAYTQSVSTECIQPVNEMSTQVRLGKVRLGKVNINNADKPHTKNFIPPILEEVKVYCQERNNNVDPEKWHNFYSSKGWMVGKNKMTDWKAAVRTWEDKNKEVGSVGHQQDTGKPKKESKYTQFYKYSGPELPKV